MSERIDNVVNELTKYIEEQVQSEVKTAFDIKNRKDVAVRESLDNNDSGSGLAYNITQFKCGDADCALTMNFIGHWNDK